MKELMNNGMIDMVDEQTRVVGSNCMETLLFSLGSNETFGINVFKVREVSKTPFITKAPNMPKGVQGFISLRGTVIPVLDLAINLGLEKPGAGLGGSMMVTEYSKRTLAFLVHAVDRIISVDWENLHTPENFSGTNNNYITAITELPDGRLVSVLDVDSILSNTFGDAEIGQIDPIEGELLNVFFVDDSVVARRKITTILDKLGVMHRNAVNGMEAWIRLDNIAKSALTAGRLVNEEIGLILVDAEMPEMDGYMLTKHIKSDSRFEGIPVVMHSSLSSEANRSLGMVAGVDAYVAKFDAEGLAKTLRPFLSAAIAAH